jgi:hypothetical protein
MKKLLSILARIAFVLLLSGCSKENSALEDFKNSAAAKEISQCVGANGSVEWKIFQPTNNQNTEVRVIEATLTKGSNKFEMQWLYNLSTKVSELAYAGKQGEKTSQIMMGLQLGLFCMQKSSFSEFNDILPQAKSVDYFGDLKIPLPSFVRSPEVNKITIELDKEFSALNIVNRSPANVIAKNYIVITDPVDLSENFASHTAMLLDLNSSILTPLYQIVYKTGDDYFKPEARLTS